MQLQYSNSNQPNTNLRTIGDEKLALKIWNVQFRFKNHCFNSQKKKIELRSILISIKLARVRFSFFDFNLHFPTSVYSNFGFPIEIILVNSFVNFPTEPSAITFRRYTGFGISLTKTTDLKLNIQVQNQLWVKTKTQIACNGCYGRRRKTTRADKTIVFQYSNPNQPNKFKNLFIPTSILANFQNSIYSILIK